MSFLSPWSFLFLLSVPVLVMLYFLKLKRPQHPVASTLLWQKVIEDIRVNSPFQRLRRSLLLLLQLLALLALIFALTRPVTRAADNRAASWIVLIDCSASMAAVDDSGKSRIDLAAEAIEKRIETVGRDEEMMMIAFGHRARVVCGFTGNRRELRRCLGDIPIQECGSRITPALELAAAVCQTRSHPRVLLVSDGALGDEPNVAMPVSVEYLPVGEALANLAVTGLDVRRSRKHAERVSMYVSIENFGEQKSSGTMEMSLDGKVLDAKTFTIESRQVLSQVFEASLPGGGVVSVRIDVDDALPTDNQAWRVVQPPAERNVLVVGENAWFVERALRSAPGVRCHTVTAAEYNEQLSEGVSAVVWHQVESPGLAPCNNLYLGCCPDWPGVEWDAKVLQPVVEDWDATHPINRFLSYENLSIAEATRFTPPGEADVLVRGLNDVPLICAWDSPGGSICLVAFSPMQSNWPLLVSFPLFLGNCMEHFSSLQERRVSLNLRTGDTIRINTPGATPQVLVPDGRLRDVQQGGENRYAFSATDRCGVYHVRAGEATLREVAVNLFDRRESDLDVVLEPVLGNGEGKAVVRAGDMEREFWRYLVMGLAALLLIEWLVYHRRWFV